MLLCRPVSYSPLGSRGANESPFQLHVVVKVSANNMAEVADFLASYPHYAPPRLRGKK